MKFAVSRSSSRLDPLAGSGFVRSWAAAIWSIAAEKRSMGRLSTRGEQQAAEQRESERAECDAGEHGIDPREGRAAASSTEPSA